MMELYVNGEPRQLPANTTLSQLVQTLGLADQRLAVELNLEVVPRSQHALLQLKTGDRIEIVHAIGGG